MGWVGDRRRHFQSKDVLGGRWVSTRVHVGAEGPGSLGWEGGVVM